MIKQYQTFKLSKDLNPTIKKGRAGVVLEILDEDTFEVEFVNDDGSNCEYKGQFTFTIDSGYIEKGSWYSIRSHPIIVFKYSAILLTLYLVTWWVMFFSPFNIPEFIPHTPIRVYGLLLSGFILTILIIAQKELLNNNDNLSVLHLTLTGITICFINEWIFQFILSFTETSDKIYYFITGVAATTALCAIFSFFIAFQLKTKRTQRLILFIVVFMILFKGLTMLFPALVKS